jgi:hypothetical protein
MCDLYTMYVCTKITHIRHLSHVENTLFILVGNENILSTRKPIVSYQGYILMANTGYNLINLQQQANKLLDFWPFWPSL